MQKATNGTPLSCMFQIAVLMTLSDQSKLPSKVLHYLLESTNMNLIYFQGVTASGTRSAFIMTDPLTEAVSDWVTQSITRIVLLLVATSQSVTHSHWLMALCMHWGFANMHRCNCDDTQTLPHLLECPLAPNSLHASNIISISMTYHYPYHGWINELNEWSLMWQWVVCDMGYLDLEVSSYTYWQWLSHWLWAIE